MKLLKLLPLAFLSLLSCKEEPAPLPPVPALSQALPAAAVTQFSAEKAFEQVRILTSMGPRPPASPGYENALKYLENQLADLGWKTLRQSFKGSTPIGQIQFTNLIAKFSPNQEADWTTSPPYLIGGHLDTKRYVDKIFVGANDSGSSTGVMVELARVLSAHPDSARSVELVFFDGEEAILENITSRDGLYGSTYYASQLARRNTQPRLAIILDIVGDNNFPLLIGGDSHKNLKNHTLVASQKLGFAEWITPYPDSITDDHIPLMYRANLPVLHLIGPFMNMPYWHKDGDTMENISPEALGKTGKLTLQILHQLSTQ